MPNNHRELVNAVVLRAGALIDAGCTCRGEHDDARGACKLTAAWLALESAVTALRSATPCQCHGCRAARASGAV